MALIPPQFLDTVVSIGVNNGEKVRWIGTGFLFGKLEKQEGDKKTYRTFLVTNKHVIRDQHKILCRFEPVDGSPSKDYEIDLDSGKISRGHPDANVDIAIIQIDANILTQQGMKYSFFASDTQVFSKQQLKDLRITEGDGVFVLGFPMGIVSEKRKHVILRGGYISRIRDLFEGKSSSYMIDAPVYPGNSGGPVILKPEIIAIQGTSANKDAGLIGIVKQSISYRDVAYSKQTGEEKVAFTENSGLSIIEPVDYIFETINLYDTFQKIEENKDK